MTTDLLLINPSDILLYKNLDRAIEPPLWCALIASYVRDKGYGVQIIDANAENLSVEETVNRIIDIDPVLTGIVVMGSNPSVSSTPKMGIVRDILNEIDDRKNIDLDDAEYENQNQNLTFLMGLHPSALPERTLNEEMTDYIVQGEGFSTILDLLKFKKDKDYIDSIKGLWYRETYYEYHINMYDIYTRFSGPAELINLDDLPTPAWDLLDMNLYKCHNWHSFSEKSQDRDHQYRSHYGIIFTSMGCPFNCSYCQINKLYSGKPGIRYRSPEKVIADIDILVEKYGVKNIKIFDELFTFNEDHVNKICDLIIKRKEDYGNKYDLNIWCYARIDKLNKIMLQKMKKAGINWLAIGFESASDIVRRGVSKRYGQDKIRDTVKMIKDTNINIIANFIFGLPDDNMETMRNTLDLAKELNCEYANFYILLPYPGSQLYDDASGQKLPETWEDYSQYSKNIVPMDTKYLTGQQVLDFRDKAFQEYFTNPRYLDIIKEKFGDDVVKQIIDMTKIKIRD